MVMKSWCEIWDFHSSSDWSWGLLGCDALWYPSTALHNVRTQKTLTWIKSSCLLVTPIVNFQKGDVFSYVRLKLISMLIMLKACLFFISIIG
jgi:hypothetical protein